MSTTNPLRGEIWDIDFVHAGDNAAIVLTSNAISRHLSHATVALITGTSGPPSTHITLDADAGLARHEVSFVDTTELHSPNLSDFAWLRGRVSTKEMTRIEDAIRLVLELWFAARAGVPATSSRRHTHVVQIISEGRAGAEQGTADRDNLPSPNREQRSPSLGPAYRRIGAADRCAHRGPMSAQGCSPTGDWRNVPGGHALMPLLDSGLSLRANVALEIGRTANGMSRRLRLGDGTTIGGATALALDPQLLKECTAGRSVVLVSGTNGKTTTTRMITEVWSSRQRVASNASGANLPASHIVALAADPAARAAVLEVDEGHLRSVCRAVRPSVVVMLNLSRDQLDRTSEVRHVAAEWRALAGELGDGCVVVANADDPMTVWAASAALRTIWVAAGQPWTLDTVLCPACGELLQRSEPEWWCSSCNLRRPRPDFALAGDHVLVRGVGETALNLRLPGRANRANAVFTLATAGSLGISHHDALPLIDGLSSVSGRYQVVTIASRQLRLLLAKNPAGWLETLAMLDESRGPVVVGVNARAADGRDTSWLWDVPFERLRGRHVLAIGDRRADLAVRLDHAGVDVALVEDLDAELARLPANVSHLDCALTYTAFQDVRRRAHER
jgi:UDP-N-acetylmuramyl tripeptide synthase/mRNA-degrading endonuclease toxin of MazEF toxin-antitoxin module